MALQNNAIGNYIHFKYNNYLKYGLSEKSSNERITESQIQKIFKDQIALVKNQLNASTISFEKIQEALAIANRFFPNTLKQTNSNLTDSDVQEIQKMLLDKITTLLGKPINIDENLQVTVGGLSVDYTELDNIRKNIGMKDGQTKTTSDAVVRRLNAFEKVYNTIKQASNKTQYDNKFISLLESLRDNYKDVIEQIKSAQQQANEANLKYKNVLIDDRAHSFLEQLNELWKIYKKTSIAAIIGDVGELYILLSQQAIQTTVDKTADEIKKIVMDNLSKINNKTDLSGWLGKDRSASVWNTQNNTLFPNMRNNLYTLSGRATQNKADVVITLNDSMDVFASVKNYDLTIHPVIHLHSGSNMLQAMQDYDMFMNHYLNITANLQRDFQYGQPGDQLIKDANTSLLLSLLAFALQGNANKNGNNQLAQFLLVNNHASGQSGGYKGYSFQQLIEKAEKNINYIEAEGLSIDKTWNNTYIGDISSGNSLKSAYSRIIKLLSQLKRQQLQISISTKTL